MIIWDNNDMGIFTFLLETNDISVSASHKLFAAPSPDKDCSMIIKYCGYEKLGEGDYQTKDLPNIFSELLLYIRKKGSNTFSVFKYNGNIWVHRHIEDNILCDDIMNFAEVSTDIQNEWNYLVQFVKEENAPK